MAHAATPTRRHHGYLGWALPLVLGISYGAYAAFIARDGGPGSVGQAVLAVVSGAVMAVLAFLLGRYQKSLPRELRALCYGALSAAAIGFLVSLTGESSVLRSTGLGVSVGAGVTVVAFYLFYTHE
ncbi:hypothetical protein QCN29_19560 [Streptomyces sp. HNM0663]|uniref:Integral membrane protein n=1 Tax=Streptomyces chengmaiensis TaxID=3040919 RepID=A0ABT6HRL7_9ACTN|nr:hypothetical protein [Streptomyces chengmaiensis]MDH2390947.1 hypothetical protein [Streptomyces chengmaiensis]